MIRDPEVIKVYARSLLAAVQPTGQLEQYIDEAKALRQIYVDEPRLRAFLEGPHIREEEKMKLVFTVFGKGRVLPMLFNLLRVLVDKKRIILLPEILMEFYVLGEEALGLVVGRVVTAVPVDTGKQRELQQQLENVTGLKFTLDFRIDENVLGGVLVQYKDVSIDGTLRGRLSGIRERLEALG